MMKTCSKCGVEKDRDGFYSAPGMVCRECKKKYQSEWGKNNRDKANRSAGEWSRKNPEKRKFILENSRIKRKFGIDLSDYAAILAAQGGVCAICHKEDKSGRRYAIDHCHSTGNVRGLLCVSCNRLLGLAYDDPKILQSAIVYLDFHRDNPYPHK